MKPNLLYKYNPKIQKSKIDEHLGALKRFNKWEQETPDKMEDSRCLAAVFELYEMIPEDARQRPVSVEGIVKMRKMLACLK